LVTSTWSDTATYPHEQQIFTGFSMLPEQAGNTYVEELIAQIGFIYGFVTPGDKNQSSNKDVLLLGRTSAFSANNVNSAIINLNTKELQILPYSIDYYDGAKYPIGLMHLPF